jgi:hypothetical protein
MESLKSVVEKARKAGRKRRRRRRDLNELDGLVSLDDTEVPMLKKLDKAVHEWLFQHTGRAWKRMSRGEYLLFKYTDQQGDVASMFRELKIAPPDQLVWLEFWSELGESQLFA